jgi:hypothetical protein
MASAFTHSPATLAKVEKKEGILEKGCWRRTLENEEHNEHSS